MSFFSKPVGALCSLLILLQLVTLATARGIRIDAKSCGLYRAQIDQALDEVEEMVKYAEKRATPKSQYKRQGTLLQDMLDASSEDDTYVLRKVQATFNEVSGTLRDSKIIIHCNDKHLTRSTPTVYFDNSNGRQARVQVLDSPKRNKALGACGGVQRAFAYPFYDAKTHKIAGEAIVLCSDSSTGALKAADLTKNVGFWRNKDLTKVNQGLDMFGRYLSYMILHELMHATDVKSFPVNPGGKPERYGYEEITGHKVGTIGHGGPASLVRMANADSYALLACGWYMNAYKVENGKFVITPKAQRPPTSLRRRWAFPALEAREPKSKPKKTSKGDDPPATSKAAPPASSQAPPPSTQAPPASSQAPPPSSKATSESHATTSAPVTTPSGSRTASVSTRSSSTSSWLPPMVTAIGDSASKFPKLLPLGIAIVLLPDFDFGNDTTNGTAPISGTGTGVSIPTFTGSAGWNDTSVPTILSQAGTGASTPCTEEIPVATPKYTGSAGWNSTMITITTPVGSGYSMTASGFVTSVTTSCSES